MTIRKRLTAPLADVLERRGVLEATFEQRRRLRQWRDDVLAAARHRTLRPNAAQLSASGRVTWVQLGSRWVLSRVERDYRTDEAIEDNLRLVLDLVSTGVVPHFLVPLDSVDGCRIGVPADDRKQLVHSLLGADLPEETYLLINGESTLDTEPLSRRRTQPAFATRAHEAERWTLVRPVTDPGGNEVLRDRYGCEIEFWDPQVASGRANVLGSSRRNAVSPTFELSDVEADHVNLGGREIPAPPEFADTVRTRSSWFPIDAVYTWVDGSDPSWRARRATALGELDTAELNEDATIWSRFENRDELRYSLRSLDQYAPFVRHVYLVTDGQVPDWLDTESPDLTVIHHRDIFLDDDRLPTFNSQAIEARIHRIPGLAEHYLYLNDDVLFGRRVSPELFFTPAGSTKYFESTAQIGTGPPTVDEPSITSAAKNGRQLLLREFGYFPTFKFKHTPHAQRREIIGEIERRFTDEYHQVGRHQFRSHLDISIASSLHHHVGHALGLSHPSNISYDYFNLPSPNLPDRLERVRSLSLDTWCLNDGNAAPEDAADLDSMTVEFLQKALPWPSRFEE